MQARHTHQAVHAKGLPRRPSRATPHRAHPIQLKSSSCSCGGGCPSCKAKAAYASAEREADAVAAQVMSMTSPSAAAGPDINIGRDALMRQPEEDMEETVQRQAMDEEEEELVQAKAMGEEEEELIQAKATDEEEEELVQTKAEGTGAPSAASNPMAGMGAGRPLSPGLRSFFEPRFGRSFADVRVHDSGAAHTRAQDLNAQAFTYGKDIVFARGRYNPDSSAGRFLLAHELTHVLQQRGGTRAIQRAPADDQIGGRASELTADDDVIFFERASAALHPDEKSKIPGIVANTKPDIRIKGFRSRDEDPGLAQTRADTVETAIKAHDKTVSTVTQPETSSFQDRVDYRGIRKVEPLKDTPASAASKCPQGSAEYDEPCPAPPASKVDIPAAFASASGDLDATLTKLRAYKADPGANAGTDAKLKKFFKAGFDIDRLIRDYRRIKKQVDRVAKKDIGKSKRKKPGYRCANECNNDCADAIGITGGLGGGCRITLCPRVWNGATADAVTTIIHECSHCTAGVGLSRQGTDDVIYEREKAIPFLSNKEALRSADLFALFVQELIHGGPDTILPTVTDDVSAIAAADQKKAEELLARLAKWLQVSGDNMRSLFDATLEAKSKGWAPIWGERLYKQIHKEFGSDFGLTRPSRKMTEKDVHAIAAIADRVTQLEILLDRNKITAKPGNQTKWSLGGSAPGILPGLEVEIDQLWLAISNKGDVIGMLLDALLEASPHISTAMAPKYAKIIKWIRKDEKIGP